MIRFIPIKIKTKIKKKIKTKKRIKLKRKKERKKKIQSTSNAVRQTGFVFDLLFCLIVQAGAFA